MSQPDSRRDREVAAIDALIVWCLSDQFRPNVSFGDDEEFDLASVDTSILTDEDWTAMDALGDDLVSRLIAKARED